MEVMNKQEVKMIGMVLIMIIVWTTLISLLIAMSIDTTSTSDVIEIHGPQYKNDISNVDIVRIEPTHNTNTPIDGRTYIDTIHIYDTFYDIPANNDSIIMVDNIVYRRGKDVWVAD